MTVMQLICSSSECQSALDASTRKLAQSDQNFGGEAESSVTTAVLLYVPFCTVDIKPSC